MAVFKFLRWLFWNAVYFVYRPRELRAYLTAGDRCRWPWWKFKPFVHFNEDGRQWEIYLEGEPCYVGEEMLKCSVHRSMGDNRIVGLTIWEETRTKQ